MERVLITGGAGFLGRGFLRQIEQGRLDWDATVYSRDETKQDECRRRYPSARYVLGDVRDVDRLTDVALGHDFIVHAAAMKYIPDAELNASECVSVNVDGSRSVIRAAKQAGIRRVVGISTDKAVQPVNVYGATKMVMERLFADEDAAYPVFACVRYGNVVGSTGSVIPVFQRQYAEDDCVQITDQRMTRFWMGVDEAIELVKVAAEGEQLNGCILVPHARAMTVSDVARAATKDDVLIKLVGMRPGEKLHELLIHHEESVRVDRQPKHYVLLPPGTELTDDTEDPFTVASHTPTYHMSIVEMRELIADSLTI